VGSFPACTCSSSGRVTRSTLGVASKDRLVKTSETNEPKPAHCPLRLSTANCQLPTSPALSQQRLRASLAAGCACPGLITGNLLCMYMGDEANNSSSSSSNNDSFHDAPSIVHAVNAAASIVPIGTACLPATRGGKRRRSNQPPAIKAWAVLPACRMLAPPLLFPPA
jgi:hypothetical protein